ncbi:MAG: GDSL-type esterase/lipase family protein [Spirulina sp.]
MSKPYLLAIALFSLSANLPELPENWQDNFWDFFPSGDRDSNTRQDAEITAVAEIVPEIATFPEFTPDRDRQPTAKLTSNSLPIPQSGAQMYRQRLAALKAGKLYTRLLPGSFAEHWSQAIAQPTHQQWRSLLRGEAKAIAKGQGSNTLHILLGDSLTAWFPSYMLPKEEFWLNQGISGENSGQIRDRLHFFAQTRPSKIYVMAGINDLRQGKSDATILNNLQAIVRRLKQERPQGEIILQSILPTRTNSLSNARIRRLNQSLAEIVRREGGTFLDLHPFFTDDRGDLRSDLTTDGIHLSEKGYRVWRSVLNDRRDSNPSDTVI